MSESSPINESPRFITKENQTKFTEIFKSYAMSRLNEKANEASLAVKESHREAIGRMIVTTDIVEAVGKYKEQRENVGKPINRDVALFAIFSSIGVLGRYFTTQSRSIPLEQFTPIIYVNPVLENYMSVLYKGEVEETLKHEVEHAVEDVLGIYMGLSEGENMTAGTELMRMVKEIFRKPQHEVRATSAEKRVV